MTATRSTEPMIRAASESDVDDIARIWDEGWADGHAGHVPEELYRHRTPETYPPRVIERIGSTWLAERDGAALGFAVVIGDEVEQVYVDAAARGTGVAALLLEHAEHAIAGAGHERAWLAVVSGNARARAFYERAGWRDAGAVDYEAETASGFVLVPCRRYEKSLTARTDAAPRRV